ncbi:TfoX/Sxy family protein [Dyella sp. 2RAB6]|uniref:TfoX/Sxy family protein n=1 Tax=Dyella sp. 2RAB6 TaxID=3232992 RepID=UPI003F8DD846
MNATRKSGARQDLEDAATHLGLAHELRFQSMFGGVLAYFSERPCAWIGAPGLALKVAAEDQPALLEIDGVTRFVHAEGAKPSRQYLVLPPALTHDTPTFAAWLERSLQAVQKKPARKRRP